VGFLWRAGRVPGAEQEAAFPAPEDGVVRWINDLQPDEPV